MSGGTQPELRQLSDAELVVRLVSGEKDALNVIMERHRPMVLAIARQILRHEAEADDTAQDVFLEALELTQFDTEYGSLAAWLRKTAQRRALDRRKHLSRRGFYSAASLDEEITTSNSDVELTSQVRELLSRLEPKERQAVIFKYVRGYTDKEIAAITGDSIRAVRHTLFLSRRKLKSAA